MIYFMNNAKKNWWLFVFVLETLYKNLDKADLAALGCSMIACVCFFAKNRIFTLKKIVQSFQRWFQDNLKNRINPMTNLSSAKSARPKWAPTKRRSPARSDSRHKDELRHQDELCLQDELFSGTFKLKPVRGQKACFLMKEYI